MSSCCSNKEEENKLPRKKTCPANQKDYVLVKLKTILHHIKNSWDTELKEQGYYFCNDPKCDVVYFGEDGATIKKSELRTKIYNKEKDNDLLVCYCFGVSQANAKTNSKIKDFVVQQTKLGNCSCETSNPSGRCCLKDFP